MRPWILSAPLLGSLFTQALGDNILTTSGFTSCVDNPSINVQNLNIQYDRQTTQITFNVAGSSAVEQSITAQLSVSAYGKQLYQKSFNPCDESPKVDKLCPVPAGTFAAVGVETVPPEYASQIPSIAFNVPDLEGQATLELISTDGNQTLACIRSDVTNGKTVSSPVISYIAAGIAGSALLVTGLSSLGHAGAAGGGHSASPGFGTVFGWFSSVATNGMLSVSYPPVYRSFSKNFAFAGGLISWNSMQTSIDNFRNVTGGNLTEDNVQYLRSASLVYSNEPSQEPSSVSRRWVDLPSLVFDPVLVTRDNADTTVNSTQNGNTTVPATNGTASGGNKISHLVYGIQGYAEQLTIPRANTFMTVLLIFSIVIATIVVGVLLFKVILETWALFTSFPMKLTGFRKRYWMIIGRTITNLILLLYGSWALFCIYQFTHGDSWAAKLLAGVTLTAFTAVLAFFSFRIWQLAHKFKKMEGDASALFEDKETWMKYSLFYDSYKRDYWWLFVPAIIYMFAKGCVIAAGDGHGLTQTTGQLIIESLMLILLIWFRPFVTPAQTWINLTIQMVRVLSVVCILVFVEELGIAQSTKTITGVILIAVQSVLTGVLAILIAVNAIVVCVRENPHRKQRKEAEKLHRDLDNLTPLDPRNSLLMDPIDYKDPEQARAASYQLKAYREGGLSPKMAQRRESSENLVGGAADMGHEHARSMSPESDILSRSPPPAYRQPTLPDLEEYRGRAL